MDLQFWFWLIMAAWFFFGLWRNWGTPEAPYFVGGHILQFVLFAIVGWRLFGGPVK